MTRFPRRAIARSLCEPSYCLRPCRRDLVIVAANSSSVNVFDVERGLKDSAHDSHTLQVFSRCTNLWLRHRLILSNLFGSSDKVLPQPC